jgi:competence protein ComEC
MTNRWTTQVAEFEARAPLVPVVVGLLLGVVLDLRGGLAPSVYVGVFLFAAGVMFWPAGRRTGGLLPVAVAAAGLGGLLHHRAVWYEPPNSLTAYVADDLDHIVRLRGRVVEEPRFLAGSDYPFRFWTYRNERTVFLLESEEIETRAGWRLVAGKVKVNVSAPLLDLHEGTAVELFGTLVGLGRPRNPGSYDWGAAQRRQGVRARLYCDQAENVRRLDAQRADGSLVEASAQEALKVSSHGTARRAEGRDGWRWPRIADWRRLTRSLLTDDVVKSDSDHASLLHAMILGHRSHLSRRLNEAFIQAGCTHFLAVSGTHVGIVMLLAWGVVRLLGWPRRRSIWLVLAVLVPYVLMAEPRPPILRAGVMGCLFCVSLLRGKPTARLNWLAAAAIVLILLDPTTVVRAGFQLSFVAVLGISYLAPALMRAGRTAVLGAPEDADLFPERPEPMSLEERSDASLVWQRRARQFGWALQWSFAFSVAAWLATAPLIAIHFQRLQPWGAVNSVIVLPLVMATMFVGFAKLVVGMVVPTVGTLLGYPLLWLDGLLVWVVDLLAKLPGATVVVPAPPAWLVTIYYAWLIAIAWLFAARARNALRLGDEPQSQGQQGVAVGPDANAPDAAGSATTDVGSAGVGEVASTSPTFRLIRHRLAAGLTLLVAGGLAFWLWPESKEPELRVHVLDVGPGAAVVLELPDGQTVLCDAGTQKPYDIGAGTVVPFLLHRGIGTLDAAYISHANLDHFSGLPAIAEMLSLRGVYTTHYFDPPEDRRSSARLVLELLAEADVPVHTLDPRVTRWTQGGVTFERLWPPAGPRGMASASAANGVSFPAETLRAASYVAPASAPRIGGSDGRLADPWAEVFAKEPNESSLVLRLTYAGRSILLTGDIEAQAQQALLDEADVRADVLLLPHHGSMRPNSAAFFEAVGPTLAVRSSNKTMAETTNGLCEALAGVDVFNTAEHGAITITLNAAGIEAQGHLSSDPWRAEEPSEVLQFGSTAEQVP